ncbi:rod shape-determining protein MreD [Undibacterium oligocarboniphilum]|uniref:Rod shape-determining protein MreD n=1 Tax=Undibacterium oligocarboniphilum TaxID=666702 RepID=A0A850Q891_9BURK|nr:rod shape-determining protein MreD [Undibacterium oligocarboniphilum]MBC3870915.1 rod shape-determining protein MreD [Undibacterium oligocarboniphilum]NVO76462.1 rod shape-determining protein MreD [Undibacterium oligocarboniphilum]
MNQPHYILLPVNPLFIALSFAVAFLLNFLPWGGYVIVPDFVALVIVFWSIHQPRKVGIGIAFAMGLLMDVHDAIHLGENALAYTLLSYFAITIHRRVLWFHPLTQSLHVFPLFLFVQGLQIVVRLLVAPDAHFPGWLYFSESVVTTLLWPVATAILLAPQKRAIDKDHTRPI